MSMSKLFTPCSTLPCWVGHPTRSNGIVCPPLRVSFLDEEHVSRERGNGTHCPTAKSFEPSTYIPDVNHAPLTSFFFFRSFVTADPAARYSTAVPHPHPPRVAHRIIPNMKAFNVPDAVRMELRLPVASRRENPITFTTSAVFAWKSKRTGCRCSNVKHA